MKSYSMRSSLLTTIVMMGMLSVGFTLFTGAIYFQQALDNRLQAFTELVELEVHNLWDELKEETQSMGLSVQSSPALKKALKEDDREAVERALNEHFHRAYVTLGIVNLKKIIIYSKELKKLYQSSEGEKVAGDVCPEIMTRAHKKTGAQRYKTLHQVCVYDDSIRLVTLVPVGGLRLQGYLAVVTDPLSNLAKAEEGLGIPVMIKNQKQQLLFKSANWPQQHLMKNILLVSYGNKAGNPEAVAYFYFASDVTALKSKLLKTRITLVSIVVITTLLAVVIALGLFRRMILTPLKKITLYLNLIRVDKSHLKDKLEISGSKELVTLAKEMCGMSRELSRLYLELEEMAFTDSLTGIPNRALLFDRLEQMTLSAKRNAKQPGFMLLMMDLNRFKAVNDELGHHVGDELLVAVASRLKLALRESDTVARIGGDEFAIILHAVSDKAVAVAVADKITALMNDLFLIEGYELDVGMSIGIACFPHEGETGEDLMHSADMAMYYAKRNHLPYVFYSAELIN
ncbi:MAG: diguanylate cyclase [Gammaproteobacteria bacterium]|nr:diguanylate cyclase [Gammaproteobacteria bacterium]